LYVLNCGDHSFIRLYKWKDNANLYPIKKGEASNIVSGYANPNKQLNHTQAINSITGQDIVSAGPGYNEEVVKNTLAMNMDEQLAAPRNVEEFEKFISKKCTDSLQRYTYMRLINYDHFPTQIDTELLILIIHTFQEQVINN